MKRLYDIFRDGFDIENENLLDLHVSGVKPDSEPIIIIESDQRGGYLHFISNDQSRDADTCS